MTRGPGTPRGSAGRVPSAAPTWVLYDHAEERVWRHLDSCQFLTYLHAQPRAGGVPDPWRPTGTAAVREGARAIHDPL